MDIFESSDSVRNARPLQYLQTAVFKEPLKLENGETLPEITVAYETYGTLNEQRTNAILLCHAISGDSHVASHDSEDDPGWWEIAVGPGKAIDTDRYFVICPNILGGCRGTTGPDSINPVTNRPYGAEFPMITIGDIVEVERILADHLGIRRFLAVVGASVGGLVVLEWATRFPDRLAGAVAVATSAHLTSQALAFDVVARNAILSDPHFHGGQYYDKGTFPGKGLAIARMLGHITYLSLESMNKKFGQDKNIARDVKTHFETKFSVGSYLAYQGDKFVERFDANSYLSLSMAMDLFELGETKEKLDANLRGSMCRWLLMSFTSDWLFPPFQSQEIVDSLLSLDKKVSYCNIKSDCGHDAFLLPNEYEIYGEMIRAFLKNLELEQAVEIPPADSPGILAEAVSDPPLEKPAKPPRFDYDRILELIPNEARVLDLGCGSGTLLSRLRERGHSKVLGLEIDECLVLRSMRRGLDVVQADLNDGLRAFGDRQFDFVVLSKTLQTVHDVGFILEEMLRVGTRCIVSFPNLGYHEYRRQLADDGRAPQIDPLLNRKWYDTHDLRFLTLDDFEEFCAENGFRIHQRVALDTHSGKEVHNDPNRNADIAIVVLSKKQ